jgi:hypothetical protein
MGPVEVEWISAGSKQQQIGKVGSDYEPRRSGQPRQPPDGCSLHQPGRHALPYGCGGCGGCGRGSMRGR